MYWYNWKVTIDTHNSNFPAQELLLIYYTKKMIKKFGKNLIIFTPNSFMESQDVLP